MEFTPFVVLGLVAAAVVSLIVYNVRQDRKRAAGRAEMAALRGWTYTPGGPGRRQFLLEGQCEGGAWQVEARTGGKNNPGQTYFKCPGAAAGGGVVYVGPPETAKMLQSGIGRTVTRWGLQLGSMMGVDTGPMQRLLENPLVVDADGTAFGEKFSVLATDTSLARKVLTGPAKEALLNWAAGGRRGRGAQVTWSDDGLSLQWPTNLSDPEQLAPFAELGMTLAREIRGGGW